MLLNRRIALVCAIGALAATPASAVAMPAEDPPPSNSSETSVAPIVREVETGGDTTLALVLSGSALLIAAGAAALSGHDHRRVGKAI